MTMRHRLLGRSGLRVSELCLGAMTFGAATEESEARLIVDAYAEAGGNFIDTAVNYAGGRSEEIVGRLLAHQRDAFVLSTKYTAPLRSGDPNSGGNHRKSMRQALELSLRRLQTDHIDVYWVHVWDKATPIDEILRALDDAVTAGKILYAGISDVPAWVVSRANTVAELRGWTPFIGLQAQYSLIERAAERELIPMASALDVALLAWAPLGRGVLTGKYNHAAGDDGASWRMRPDDERVSARGLEIAAAVGELAASIDASPSQVALSWLRQREANVLPLVGARTVEQARDWLGAVDLVLDADALERLDDATRIPLGFPHDFLASLRRSAYAERSAADQLDSPRSSSA
jgi:aryl-alcohol dehydrogenase-like predicted oxidoreductase